MSEPNAQEPAETPTEQVETPQGAQPSEPAQEPNPSPETTGSQPSIPKPRFDEVIHERNTERETNRQLRERLAQYERPAQQPNQRDPLALPDENDPKYGGNYQAYLDDRAAVIARREFQQQQQYSQAANQVQNAWRGVNQKAMEQGATDPTAYDLPQVLGQFQNPVVALAVAESPDNTAILRYFRANPQELGRMQYMTPYQQLMEVGRIQGKLAGSKGQPTKVSQMPAPMAPVGAGKVGGKVDGKYTQQEVLDRLYGAPS